MTIDTLGAVGGARPVERTATATATTATHGEAAVAHGAARTPATAVETADAVKGPDAVPTLDQVHEAVAKLNKSSQDNAQGLEFSVDSDTKRTVVKVVDQNTKEVLRQFPTKEALAIAKSLESKSGATGLLIQQTA